MFHDEEDPHGTPPVRGSLVDGQPYRGRRDGRKASAEMSEPPARGHALGARPRNPEAKAPASLDNRPGREERGPLILSFARTSEAFMAGVKTVSRRDWSERYAMQWVKAWEEGRTRHQAWNKVPRCNGAHQIGFFDLKACVYQERLVDMPEEDVKAEGGL
jgi:hypothetical protein